MTRACRSAVNLYRVLWVVRPAVVPCCMSATIKDSPWITMVWFSLISAGLSGGQRFTVSRTGDEQRGRVHGADTGAHSGTCAGRAETPCAGRLEARRRAGAWLCLQSACLSSRHVAQISAEPAADVQVTGRWRCEKPNLQPLKQQAVSLRAGFVSCTLEHVLRYNSNLLDFNSLWICMERK